MFHALNSTQDQFRQVISKLGNMPFAEGYDVEEVGESFSGINHFAGGVLLHDGTVLLIPFVGSDFCIYDSIAKTVLPVCKKLELVNSYCGGVLMMDGNVLCVPNSAQQCCIYDSKTRSVKTVGAIVNPSGAADYFLGGALLKDGRVLLVPFAAGKCWIYDPCTGATEPLSHQFSGSAFIGCQLLPDGRVLLVPRAYRCVVIYDPVSNTFVDSAVCFGYACAALLPSGAVFAPFYFAPKSVVINTDQHSLAEAGTPAVGGAPYSFGTATLGDGGVCVVPRGGPCARVYNHIDGSMVDIPRATGGNDAYCGGLALPDGSALLIPRRKPRCMLIKPRGVTPLPKATCLSPYLNKF